MGLLLEVPVFSAESALRAAALGARRIELNAPGSYAAGGLTPAIADVTKVSSVARVPLRIMIRPRGPNRDGAQDFIYNEEEFQHGMLKEIQEFRDSGLLDFARGDGFVFGILECVDGRLNLDKRRNSELVHTARPFGCTFHRAFDDAIKGNTDLAPGDLRLDWDRVVDDVIACGFDAILTSGGPGNAIDHLDALAAIVEKAGGRFQIIVGGGVRSRNAAEIVAMFKDIGHVWVHSSCLTSKSGESVDEDNSEYPKEA
jgi:copper homeostasis protein